MKNEDFCLWLWRWSWWWAFALWLSLSRFPSVLLSVLFNVLLRFNRGIITFTFKRYLKFLHDYTQPLSSSSCLLWGKVRSLIAVSLPFYLFEESVDTFWWTVSLAFSWAWDYDYEGREERSWLFHFLCSFILDSKRRRRWERCEVRETEAGREVERPTSQKTFNFSRSHWQLLPHLPFSSFLSLPVSSFSLTFHLFSMTFFFAPVCLCWDDDAMTTIMMTLKPRADSFLSLIFPSREMAEDSEFGRDKDRPREKRTSELREKAQVMQSRLQEDYR